MADVRLKCTACGREMKISEYADVEKLVCPTCGQALRMPARTAEPHAPAAAPKKGQLSEQAENQAPPQSSTHFKLKETQPLKTAVTGEIEKRFDPTTAVSGRGRTKKKARSSTAQGASVFLLLVIVLGYLRYVPMVSQKKLNEYGVTALTDNIRVPRHLMTGFRKFGLGALGVLYVTGILLAWKDEMWQGLLCTVIPLYPFYYLLFVTDIFVMRGITAAFIIGFGPDVARFLHACWFNSTVRVDSWIQGVTPKDSVPYM